MQIQLSISARKTLADTVDGLIDGGKQTSSLVRTISKLNDLAIGPVADIKAAGFASKKEAQAKLDALSALLNKKPSFKPKVNTGDPKRDLATSPSGRVPSANELKVAAAKAGDLSAAEITNIAQGLVDKMRKRHLPIMSDNALRKAATEAVGRWVTHSNASKLTKEVKQKAANKLIARVVALFTKGGAPKKAGVKQPAGFSAPDGAKAKAKKFSKDEIAKISDRLSYKVQFGSGKNKTAAIKDAVEEWASLHSVQYPNQSRLLSKDAVTKALTALMEKKAAAADGKKAPVKAPADKVVQTTKAATKEEKLKAQILAGTKLRNQFQGMLTKAPAMTGKSIENIRAHCAAYLKVINAVQKGKADLAETTKIEGLRGIDSVKNYVNSVLGLTYGYVEFAKYLGVSQTILGEKISDEINMDTTNVELKRIAKANAQRNLGYVEKALTKRGCVLPTSFQREVEKVFVDAAMSEDYKKAKALLRDRIDTLVADVFRNKVKLYQAK